ncbi:MAG: Peptidyl-tRNA hydrolase [Calditrichaeota bacterium]|nr:Peptidyl-tRNA hydrolase [Calditrichota bacterium]
MDARLVVGLGNPGPQYEATWHNLGFRTVRRLASRLEVSLHEAGDTLVARTRYAGIDVTLLQPRVYMNRSGIPVRECASRIGLDPDEILVICDDHDLPRGKLRLRERGGDGGHRGLRSVLSELVSEDVVRLRVGIRDERSDPAAGGYDDLAGRVLEPLAERELAYLDRMAEAAADAARDWLVLGANRAMNIHNRRRVLPPDEPGRGPDGSR